MVPYAKLHKPVFSDCKLQASPVSTQSANKRPLPDSPSAPSPSNLPPLSQRIRKDIQIGEREVESPEKEVLRSPPFLVNSPAPCPPCSSPKGIPSPAPLVFTPVPASLNCLNCESVMTPNHQCEELISSSLASCGQAVNFGSVTTLAKSLGDVSELKPSQSELSDDGTPPGLPLLKRIIRPKKFCDL